MCFIDFILAWPDLCIDLLISIWHRGAPDSLFVVMLFRSLFNFLDSILDEVFAGIIRSWTDSIKLTQPIGLCSIFRGPRDKSHRRCLFFFIIYNDFHSSMKAHSSIKSKTQKESMIILKIDNEILELIYHFKGLWTQIFLSFCPRIISKRSLKLIWAILFEPINNSVASKDQTGHSENLKDKWAETINKIRLTRWAFLCAWKLPRSSDSAPIFLSWALSVVPGNWNFPPSGSPSPIQEIDRGLQSGVGWYR